MTPADETTRFEVTGVAQRAAWAAGVLPPVEQVRPGLFLLLQNTFSLVVGSDQAEERPDSVTTRRTASTCDE